MLVSAAVLTRIFSNSIANLFQKQASESNSSVKINTYSYLIMSLMCIIPALFVDWTVYNTEFWLNVFMAGVLCTTGTLALIEALKIGELSVLAPINSYKSVVGLISAFILLRELPTVKEFVCVIFIIIGSYFVLAEDGQKFSISLFLRKDVRLRFFALICSGVEASFLKKIILLSNFKISLILWCFCGLICSLIIMIIKKEKEPVKLPIKTVKQCFVIGSMLILMQLTTNYVFSKMDVGVALSLFQLSSLVSLFFGYKVYHEKNMRKKITGTVIMILSAVGILMK